MSVSLPRVHSGAGREAAGLDGTDSVVLCLDTLLGLEQGWA